MPETKEVGVRPHRRPVYQPKAQTGVTNFQPLLKGTTTPDSAANTGKGKQEEELIAEDNGNDEERVEHDDKSKHEEEHEVELVEKKASSEALVEDFLDPDFCVYVPRDYSGMEVAYQREFPKELEGVITEEQFQYTIDTVNEMLHSAQKLSCLSCLGSLVAYMTCTLIYLCKKTRMEKAFEAIGTFLYEVNEHTYHPKGLHVVHPMCRGLRTIVIRSIVNYPLYLYVEKKAPIEVE